MTTRELIALLAEYPDDTPVFIGKDYDLHARQVTETVYDDWANSTKDEEGYETPARGTAIHIGSRF